MYLKAFQTLIPYSAEQYIDCVCVGAHMHPSADCVRYSRPMLKSRPVRNHFGIVLSSEMIEKKNTKINN